MKTSSKSLKKENAILKQKLEFLDMELKEVREALEEQKRSHESILNAFENTMTEDTPQVDEQQLTELKQVHEQEIKHLSQEF